MQNQPKSSTVQDSTREERVYEMILAMLEREVTNLYSHNGLDDKDLARLGHYAKIYATLKDDLRLDVKERIKEQSST